MKKQKKYIAIVLALAIPVTIQSMLQSSFSIIDQFMIGRLGKESIAAIGIAGKFASIFYFVIASVAAVAGIMISQYIGAKNKEEASKSLALNLIVSLVVASIFVLVGVVIPDKIMGCYSKDEETVRIAANYLRILSISFIPIAFNNCVSTMLRCLNRASFPLIASFLGAILNTGINYLLIFGKLGAPKFGVNGAAIASVIASVISTLVVIIMLAVVYRKEEIHFELFARLTNMTFGQYLIILLPLLSTEFLWSVGESVYASIYGHIGTDQLAAMTLTNPIQGLLMGALSGISQAAGILVGKRLGQKEYDEAYKESKLLLLYGFISSLVLSLLLIALRGLYVDIYNVENEVKELGSTLLFVFAIISPIKVMNMIIGGGILRSGGKTNLVMMIDIIGTWGIGVPVGLVCAYLLNMSIAWVYFCLSMEEAVRLLISSFIFRSRKWMRTIE